MQCSSKQCNEATAEWNAQLLADTNGIVHCGFGNVRSYPFSFPLALGLPLCLVGCDNKDDTWPTPSGLPAFPAVTQARRSPYVRSAHWPALASLPWPDGLRHCLRRSHLRKNSREPQMVGAWHRDLGAARYRKGAARRGFDDYNKATLSTEPIALKRPDRKRINGINRLKSATHRKPTTYPQRCPVSEEHPDPPHRAVEAPRCEDVLQGVRPFGTFQQRDVVQLPHEA